MSKARAKNIADIAMLAGVTPASVSLAFKDSPELSERLKEHIRRLALEHNFKPRKYQRRTTVPAHRNRGRNDARILYIQCCSDGDPVGMQVMQSVMTRLNEHGEAYEVRHRSELIKNGLPQFNIGGVIYHYDLNDPRLEEKLQYLPSVKVLGRAYLEKIQTMDYLGVDNRQVGNLAAEYLLGRGFVRCVGVMREEMQAASCERMKAFTEKLKERNVAAEEMVYSKQNSQLHHDLARHLAAAEGRLGIFAFNDIVCFNICTTLEAMGIERGEKVEVISCDNTYLIRQLSPVPPAIDPHIADLGVRAADAMVWRLKNPDTRGMVCYIDPELVIKH